ncbi:uncharacterized protein LOC125282188 [Ursus arctos]|uniref:uncharacterized protein LOC125282188 n=1 Tax=Ursus arctos TaxID=9644 RepID=UPI00254834A7|nr:uncharacterized protein LOC125282188 [Ursus arctos]
MKGDSAGGTPLTMVTPSPITSESDVTDDGAVWSWLYQRIPEEEGLPPDKGTGACGECDALEEALDPMKGDSAGGTPLTMGTGASGECDALEEALDPIKGDSAGGTPLALVTPSTITSESDVTDDGAVWSWLYQRIPEEEGLPPDKGTGACGECDALEEALDPMKGDSAGGTPLTMGTGASGECDALEEALDPIKGDSAGGTPLALVTPSTITSESDVTDDGAVWSWLYQRIPEEEGLPPDKGTGACGECDALEEALDPMKGDSAGGTPLTMVTPSTITSESDVTDDGAVWSWLYQRIPEEEGLPPDKGTGACGECDALEEALDPMKGDSARGTPLTMGTGACGECDALEEALDPIKGNSAGGTPLTMVTPSTITSESDVTDDGAVWSWLYQRIPEEEGLPPDKGTGACGECDALEEALDPIKGNSAGGTPLTMVTPSTITSESDVTDDGAVWSWLYQRIPEEEGLPPDKGTGACGECDALEEALDPMKGDSAGGTPLTMGTGACGECDALEEALDPIKGNSAGGTPLTMGTGACGECDALEEALDPIKGDSAGGTPLALGTGASGECDQAMTMATVVRKEDDFAGCEDSDP